ncbi:hypothetical protein [Frankia casuarinae]|uniref:hypothetical protein n=1 Tax=Frankia casuarinae (strain DSM 45818 / CECT 9043 / HFP020203 / CcI3) TaxID=106370 RepID=UPI00030EDC4C|nr:hypothetical protein [Frankia casuarinae]
MLDPPLADMPADLADVVAGTAASPPGAVDVNSGAAVPGAGVRGGRETGRGATRADGSQVHLLGVVSPGAGAMVGQREIDAKTNENAEFRALLAPLALTGAFVWFDTLHTVRATGANA